MPDAKTRFQFSLLTLSLVTIAYALGLATPNLVEYFKSGPSEQNLPQIEMSLVVVCANHLQAGAVIANKDIIIENWPTAVVPNSGFTRPQQVIGKTVQSDMHKGQAITSADLQGGSAKIK
jgi:Flp pilus assembly protein CpaB